MIYFISDNNYTKIGYSTENVLSRLKGLQTGNPNKLKVNLIIPGDYFLENKFHKLFKDYKTEADNEWFNLTPDIINKELNKRYTEEQLKSYRDYTIRNVGENYFKNILEIKLKTKIIKKIHNEIITNYIIDFFKTKKHLAITYSHLCDKFGLSIDDMKNILKKDNLLNKMSYHNKNYKKNYEIKKDRDIQLEYINEA